MEKTFRYHRYLFVMARKLPRVSLGIIAACWLPPLLLYVAMYHELYMPLVRLAFVGSLTVIFMALLFAMILNELCNTVFIVSDTSLIKKSPYKVKVIHFERVNAFRYIKIPLLKGYGELSMAESAVRLPFLIDGLPKFILSIKQGLDAHAKQEAYNGRAMYDFIKQAQRYQTSIYRMQRTIGTMLQIALWNMVFSGIVAQVFWNIVFRWVLCWALIGLVVPVIGYLASEALLRWKRARQEAQTPEFLIDGSSGNKADADERHTYRFAAAITAVVYLAAGIFFKHLI